MLTGSQRVGASVGAESRRHGRRSVLNPVEEVLRLFRLLKSVRVWWDYPLTRPETIMGQTGSGLKGRVGILSPAF